jgi:chromate reductase, NAD(P)H dehydrogenase (quinone)
MAGKRDVAVFVGSLRKESFSRKVARAFAKLAPESLALDVVDIRDVSLYDQDLDDSPPAPWVALRDRIRRADAVLFVTPEYNRSVPGVLKNSIDVASRPYGESAWDAKPAAVISVTPGALGAFGANHHLRQSLVFLNVPELTDARTRELLTRFGSAFATWIERNAAR